MTIWDHGSYTLTKRADDELEFVLPGECLRDPYALVRIAHCPNDCLLITCRDE